MKARVNGTRENVTIVKNIGYPGGYVASNGRTYHSEDLTLIVDEEPDYWTCLEHQAGIAAMQGLMSKEYLDNPDSLVCHAIHYAHALVEKMKEERK